MLVILFLFYCAPYHTHLHSESSSCIDGTITRPPHSTAHQTHTTDKSQKATTQPRIPIPMASLSHSTYLSTSSNTAHVPASLAYELSTHRVLKPEPVRPRRRVSSFSRELSKRPLEVLRRRSGQLYPRQQELLEKTHVPKIITNIDGETEENLTRESEWSALKQSAKRHSYQMHLPTAEIEPPTDLPAAGVRPCYQPSSADPILGNPPTHHQHTVEIRPSQVRFHRPPASAVHMDNDEENINFVGPPTTTVEDGGGFQPRVPSTILLQLNTDVDEQYESHPLSGFESRRSRHSGHVVHTPRHQLLAPKSTVVVHPFSKEASPNHELETRGLLLKRRESALQSRERKSRESYHQQSAVSAEHVHEHPPPLPSVSPDYMLVGAHFADNNLVLVDKDGKIVHQLTDTEGESDANIIAHLSELNIHTQTSIDQQVLPRMESLNFKEVQSAVEASKPGTGMKAPPPTALEHSHNSVEGMEGDSEQGLVHVPEVEEGAQTEAEPGDVIQETVTETQPIAYCEENETKRHVEIRSQDEKQETLLTVKSEAEWRDYRQVKAELKSEDDIEQTLHVPIAEHEEDKIPENKSVDEGAAEIGDRESEITSKTDAELQVRTLPEKDSKSEDESGPAGMDTTVEVPVSTTEQSAGSDYGDSEENQVEGITPVITHSDSSS